MHACDVRACVVRNKRVETHTRTRVSHAVNNAMDAQRLYLCDAHVARESPYTSREKAFEGITCLYYTSVISRFENH